MPGPARRSKGWGSAWYSGQVPALRTGLGLSQEALAQALGVSSSKVSRLLKRT